MRLSPAFIICATLYGMTGPGLADTVLASAPVYGGPTSVGGFINCRLFNAGSSMLTIKSPQIFNNVNTVVSLNSNTCSTALGPLKYCAYVGSISGNFAFSCHAVIAPPRGKSVNVRGVAEVQNPGFAVMNALPMTR
jgi:hypothetical protein